MGDVPGTIFNIQRFSTEDGPGIRTTVFMKGCPLRCSWCANPESQSFDIQVAHRQSRCRGCGNCVRACPSGAVSVSLVDGAPATVIDRGVCRSCGACVDACTAGSMRLYGRRVSADEVFDEVERDIGYYFKSGGGLTVSGGEPMQQADFAAELFRRSKALGIHTALDTCGFFPAPAFEKVDGLVDLVLFDLKLMDEEQHKLHTGVSNRQILQNLHLIHYRGVEIYIRIPLIPGINDTDENLTATAEFVRALDKGLHVDLLPYHNYGENKYKMLDMGYALHDAHRQDPEKLERCREIFVRRGLDCAVH